MNALAKTVSNKSALSANGNIPVAKQKATGKATGGNVKRTAGKVKIAAKKTVAPTWQTRGNEGIKAATPFVAKDFKSFSNADADKAIVQIKRSGLALKTMSHKAACGIMLHYVEHGDYTKIDGLLTAVMVGMGRKFANGLVDWVRAFSSLQYDEKAMVFNHRKGEKRYFHLVGDVNAAADTWHSKGALNHAFWSGSFADKEEKPIGFDADKYLEESLNRILKKFEDMLAKKYDEKTPAKIAKKIAVDRDHINAIKSFGKTMHVKLSASSETANTVAS